MSRSTTKSRYGFAGFILLALAVAACSDATKDGSSTAGVVTGDTSGGGTGGATTAGGGSTGGTGGSDGGGNDGGGTTSADTILYGFDDVDAGFDCWKFNDYQTGTDDAGNPIDPNNLSKLTTASIDSSDGHPTPGSMKLEIPFTAYNQKTDFHCVLTSQMDLSNKVLSAWVKLDSGFSTDPSAPGGFVLYIKSGSTYAYAQAPWHNVDGSNHNWVQYFFDVKNGIDDSSPGIPPADFDPTKIVEIGFYIHTGGAGDMPDAHATPMNAVFHIDSFGLRDAE